MGTLPGKLPDIWKGTIEFLKDKISFQEDVDLNNNDLLNVDNINFSTATELTISSSAITVDQTLHTVDTESDASSDDLTTINRSGSENFVIIRPQNDGRTIVVKHGSGNIVTFSQNDLTLDTTDKAILLVYDSTNSVWQAIGGGGITGLAYDSANDELDATKTLNLNDNPITNVSSIDYGGKFGVKWNQSNQADSELERLGGAERLSPGAHYDSLAPWGEMKRCNVADDGTVNAYRGDSSYVEDGSNGQVMVEIPQFYYRIVQGTDYWEWWISPTNQTGYSLHPAFSRGGSERDHIYVGAYEATVYDNSAGSYVGDGITYDYSNDVLASVADLQPISGNSDNLDILEARQMASNRGSGWAQMDYLSRSAVYMLYLVEYADFNTQRTISEGITNLDSGSGNHSQNTGHTSGLGNETGEVVISSLENGASGASETYACSYRGIENLWGNIWNFNDGIYVLDDGFYYQDDPSAWKKPADMSFDGSDYTYVSATPINSDGYIDDYLYNSSIEWLFYASSTGGTSTTEVCDKQWSHDSGEKNILLSGGRWGRGSHAGLGCLFSGNDVTSSGRVDGSRLEVVG